MQRDEFLAVVEPESTLRAEEAVLGKLRIKNADGALSLDGAKLTEEAYHSLCKTVGIPWDYAHRFPAPLMVPHISHLLSKAGDAKTGVYTMGDAVVGFGNAASGQTNLSLFGHIESVIGKAEEITMVDVGMSDSTFTVVSGTLVVEPRVGDVVKAGIKAYVSPLGLYAPQLSLINWRMFCSNGMVSAEDHRTLRARSSQTIEELVNGLWSDADPFLEQLRRSADVKLPANFNETLPSLYDELGIPARSRRLIQERVDQDPPETLYDLTNHITWVGTHGTEGYAGHVLQHAAGRLIDSFEICDTCRRPMLDHTH